MSLLSRSDVWFALIILMFFSILAVLFFGSAITDVTFWVKIAFIFGFSFLANLTSIMLARFGARVEALGAFAVGSTFGFSYQLAQSRDVIDFLMVAMSGLGFFMITYIFRMRENDELSNE